MHNKFWYTIGQPRNLPCWEVNPKLWKAFKHWMIKTQNIEPLCNSLYTEQYIVQFLDSTTREITYDH